MRFNRIILDKQITKKLSILKGKTELTPNILCRYGLMLSLKDPTIPDANLYNQDGQELARHILLGDLDTIIIALFMQRAYNDGLDLKDEEKLLNLFRAHVNRGAELLYNRVKDVKGIFGFIKYCTL